MFPERSLPAALRTSGGSIPWSMEFLIRWSRGSPRASITVLSISVSSPENVSSTSFPFCFARSRTMRGNRWNT
jgi:hypothetical protein